MNNKETKLPKHNQEVRQRLACSDFEVMAPFSCDHIVMGGVGMFPTQTLEWTLGGLKCPLEVPFSFRW